MFELSSRLGPCGCFLPDYQEIAFLMNSSSNHSGLARGEQRKNLLSNSAYIMPGTRNPRVDGFGQPQSNASVFDTSSPGSIDFNFPFGGSPHGSSNSGIDAPPDLRLSQGQAFAARGSVPSYGKVPSPQHRPRLASIDSAFDRDLFGSAALSQWDPTNTGNQAPSNADSSPRVEASTGDQEKKSQTEDDKAPAWSELRTKAGKERNRLPLACIACR